MLKQQTYTLEYSNLTITNDVLQGYIKLFWKDIFIPLNSHNPNIHLMLLCKVQFVDSTMGYRTLADLRRVNFSDRGLFTEYLVNKLGVLSDSYKVTPVTKIIFSYAVKDGVAKNNQHLFKELEYEVRAHNYNNLVLPLSMDPKDYGVVILDSKVSDNKTRYVIDNNGQTFIIDVTNNTVNNVRITGAIDLAWTDIRLSDNTFKRIIGKNTLYIRDGIKVVSSKELNAKPFRKLTIDNKLTPVNKYMTIDIETVTIEGSVIPYLICGYTKDKYIHSYAAGYSIADTTEMFVNFINQLTKIDKSVKYIYAHNLSGFDGILLLRHLVEYKSAISVEPLIFNGKLMSIKFKFPDGKKTRTLVFKDSYLLLPLSLRSLCTAFGVPSMKGHFPFAWNEVHYSGPIPDKSYWTGTDITTAEYNQLVEKYKDNVWDFQKEAIEYCKLDCKCLYEVIEKFNELVFKEFSVNVHPSLTLPALAMRIFKSRYMPDNTIYQMLGRVENDIRQSYTGGATDVYIPTNIECNPFSARIPLFYYDANSLYPFIMAVTQLPIGKPTAFEGDITQFEENFFEEYYGFFYCNINCPDFIRHPVLQRRIKTKDGVRTIAGTGKWTGWITQEELLRARDLGYTIDILRGYKFQKGFIFKEYVQKMYNLRTEYSKSHPMNLIAKLLMNSLYGKFGMKPHQQIIEVFNVNSTEQAAKLQDNMNRFTHLFKDVIQLSDHIVVTLRLNVVDYERIESNELYHGVDVNIAIASSISAGGRVYMSRLKNSQSYNVYYSDTDSIVIDQPLPDAFVGDRLGQFKLEHHLSRAVFLAPKVYAFVDFKQNEVVKVKGLSNKTLLKTNTRYKDIEALLQKDAYKEFNQLKWFKSLLEGTISVAQIGYQLQVTSNKRAPIYGGLGIFSGTRPYNYSEFDN